MPLTPLQTNAFVVVPPATIKVSGHMRVTEDAELLFKAVARSATCMAELGAHPKAADNAGVPGVLALRALGYDHDGYGNATHNERAGWYSNSKLVAQEALFNEREARLQLEKNLADLSQELQSWRNGRYLQQFLEQSERAHVAAIAAAEAAHANSKAEHAKAMAEQRVELERAMSVCQKEVRLAQEHARLAVEQARAELAVSVKTLKGELISLERAAARTRAAKLIADKWRKRSARAKKNAKTLRETLPLTEEWSKEFKQLLLGRGVPPEQDGLRELWECQLRCLHSKRHRCRWHPKVLAWCADIWYRDRGAYEQMAFGKVLILPHPDTIRKMCSRSIARPGHNDALYDSLGPEGATKGWKDEEREVFLKFDEININAGLAWRQVKPLF
jgi:hypothetical protein